MKILHIISGLGNGGAEGALLRLTTATAEHSHEVISLTGHGWTSGKLIASGIPVHVLGFGTSGSRRFAELLRLSRLIRSIQPDVVQTWMYHADLLGGIAARLSGLKAVVWGVRASTLSSGREAFATRFVRSMCARLSNSVPAKIVCNSQAGARVHQQLGYAEMKMVVISNGYDLAELRPDPEARARSRCAWGCAPNEPLLGMVARWDVLKDHRNFVRALSILREFGPWKCVLIGQSMDESNQELIDLLTAHRVLERVILRGPADDIRAVMSSIDIHVLSSSAEAFPNAVAEAMACGTPCVVTDVGDAALIVGKTGWVVPPSDPPALARALQQAMAALGDLDEWVGRQQASRRRIAENYALSQVADNYLSVWQSVSA